MNKKIETFLQDIHQLDNAQLDKQKLESQLELLMLAKPEIVSDDAFKHKLRTRLNNIIEFKQSNAGVKKIGYLKILFPIFACFLFIIGIFSIIDIKLPGQDDLYTPPAIAEPQNIIDPNLAPREVAEQISKEEEKQKALTRKQQILEQVRLKKLAEEQGIEQTPISDETIFGEQKSNTVEAQLGDITSTPNKSTPSNDAPIEPTPTPEQNINTPEVQESITENTDIQQDNNDSNIQQDLSDENSSEVDPSSTQLQGTPPINDTPEADINIGEDDDSLSNDLIGPLGENSDVGESSVAEDSEIAREIFTQSCEAFGGSIQNSSDTMICIRDEVALCSRVDYENGKCSFLE